MRGALNVAVASKAPILGAAGATADQVALTGRPAKDGPGRCPWYGGSISVDVGKMAGVAFYDAQYALFAEWGVDFVKNGARV